MKILHKIPGFPGKYSLFSLMIVSLMGPAIALTVAVFSLGESLLLHSLPYDDAERLMLIDRLPIYDFSENASLFAEWSTASGLLSGTSLYAVSDVGLYLASAPTKVTAVQVSPDFFNVLRVRPELGRTFAPTEGTAGLNRVAVISTGVWTQHFGRDPEVCGKVIRLDGVAFQIIGVVKQEQAFPASAAVWTPTAHDSAMLERFSATGRYVLVRLRHDVSIEQAASQQASWFRNSQFAKTIGAVDSKLSEPVMLSLRDELAGPFKQSIRLLAIAAGLVLAVTCGNLVFITLSRLQARRHELAIQQALGISVSRMLWNLVHEHFTLALLGGLAGLAIVAVLFSQISFLLPESWPTYARVELNWQVLVAIVLAAMVLMVLAAVGPLFRTALSDRENFYFLLGSERSTRSRMQKRLQSLILFGQTVMAITLLAGALATVQLALRLYSEPLGYEVGEQTILTLSQPESREGEPRSDSSRAFLSGLRALQAVPGVVRVSGTDILPLRAKTMSFRDLKNLLGQATTGSRRIVAPEYFRTMSIRLIAGRDFTETDDAKHELVTVVSPRLATALWPSQAAIGQILVDGSRQLRVVGVVADIRFFGPLSRPEQEYYRPVAQVPARSFSYVVVPETPGVDVVPELRAAIRTALPEQVLEDVVPLRHYHQSAVRIPLALAGTLSLLSSFSIIIVLGGVFGTSLYVTAQAGREIAIRFVLGASTSRLIWATVRDCLFAILPGIAIGLLLTQMFVQDLQLTAMGTLQLRAAPLVGLAAAFIVFSGAASLAAAAMAIRANPWLGVRAIWR